MKYTVHLAGRTFVVAVNGDQVTVDGRQRTATLSPIPNTPLRQLTVDGRSLILAVDHDPQGCLLQWGGRTMLAEVEDERARQIRELTGQGSGHQHGGIVKAPMPGLVIRLEVDVGQAVEPDSGVVVLEAMKMENEIKAGVSGVVRAVRVAAGDAVEKGAALVEISEP